MSEAANSNVVSFDFRAKNPSARAGQPVETTHKIRVVTLGDDYWFAATDVAEVLGYRDATAMVRILDGDEKGTHILCTLGGDQKLVIISETGLYTAIIRSRKPEAVPFKRWVTKEVLPSLRKTGSYTLPEGQSMPLPSSVAAAMREVMEARQRVVLGFLPMNF